MKRILLASLMGATLAAGAQATTAPPAPDDAVVVLPNFRIAAADDHQAEAWNRWSEEFSREMRSTFGAMFGSRMVSGKVVKGAPYSAEVLTETHQTLADGNVISRKTTGRVYRDTAGRTRQESGAGRDMSVFIIDPVDGKSIVLNPGTKRAIVDPRGYVNRQVVKVDGTEVRVENGKVFIDGRPVTDGSSAVVKARSGKEVRVENGKVFIDGKEVPTAPSAPPHVTVKRIDSSDGTHREEVRVQVIRSGDGHDILVAPAPPMPPVPPLPPMPPGVAHAPLAPLPPMPGISTLRFESTARLGKGVPAILGTKDVEGVRAEGKSTTWTIPAGEIGNRHPIHIVSESWYSPDLQLTVYSRYADPRTGESIYRLAGIRRAEPAAELFTAPAGYTVDDRNREREEAREKARREREEARKQRDESRRKPG